MKYEHASFLTFRVSKQALDVSRRLWNLLRGPKPKAGFACDGCSMSPDKIRKYKIWPACVVHDFHYEPDAPLGGTWYGRLVADRFLRDNIYDLMRAQGASHRFAKATSRLYYGRVRIWGAKAYFYAEGEEPLGFRQRLREIYGGWEPRPDAVSQTSRAILKGGGVGRRKP